MVFSGKSISRMMTTSGFKFRAYRFRRWWASNSGIRKFSLTFFCTVLFFVGTSFTLFMTCFSGTDVRYNNHRLQKRSFNQHFDNSYTGTFISNYVQGGRIFLDRGKKYYNVSAPVTTSLVYSFSPEVERFFKEAIYDPFNENRYVSLGPAIIEKDDGSLLSIQRIWLSHYDVLYNKDPEIKTKNTWQENFLYDRVFDTNWAPLERGRILGIPTASNCLYAYRSDGPMDPRLFRWNDTIFISFHIWQFDRDQSDIRGRMFMWNYERNQLVKLNVPNDFKHRLQRTEINWIPITVNNSLYYIYSFDPLRVFHCVDNGDCTYEQWPKGEAKVPFDAAEDVIRGGSPFEIYQWPYYISIGHSQVGTVNDDKLLYGAHIIVMSVHPYFRLVYVSTPIQVKDQLLNSAKITRQYTILRPFLFPVGLILRTPDVLDFSAHLSDTRGYIFRLRGIEQLMKNVINADKLAGEQNPSWSQNKEPLRFRLSHSLVAKDLATHYRVSRIQYPNVVEHDMS